MGQAWVDEALRINHEKHLAGEVNPSWEVCLESACPIIVARFKKPKIKEIEEEGESNGNAAGGRRPRP
jgi:hypothetical protein